MVVYQYMYKNYFLSHSAGFDFVIGSFFAIIAILVIWSLVWKGLALWTASRRNEKGWFIALLILNTCGILEIIYLAFVAKYWNKSPQKIGPTTPMQNNQIETETKTEQTIK